ncbi:hypothetical protein [Marinococcus halophilus]|uniref:hypothetical protein n=1 Tax=Marinococcus halophilus TaxID=1371 RepID=UPI0011811526|nr:hypothetical protein [Marinococcus halophilus]
MVNGVKRVEGDGLHLFKNNYIIPGKLTSNWKSPAAPAIVTNPIATVNLIKLAFTENNPPTRNSVIIFYMYYDIYEQKYLWAPKAIIAQ